MGLVVCDECRGKVSEKAFLCPHCGALAGEWRGLTPQAFHAAARVGMATGMEGYEYRSEATLLGWPLVHVAKGIDPETGRRRIARGVIAVGDVAVGGLAIGGVAVGGVTLGGLSLGLVALGGLGVGILLGVGGIAVGMLAFGGMAVGGVAVGGGAFGYYALGGGSFGVHTLTSEVRDPEAVRFFKQWLGPWLEALARGGRGR